MAPEAPDPQSLTSWHDAFQYPIPTVRRVEQELRRDIASNKEKLRALVGTRYRELVGTAETIVSMNQEIQDVESILTDVGRRCNPRLVEKKHQHARLVKSDAAEKDGEKHAFGAQLALLHRCTTSIARLLRKRASLLLVAKIMVVSRLLHTTLSKHESTLPFLDDLRNQLASLRRALLKRIDKRLTSINVPEDNIIESLAAYCLATSSSSDDAIHHFHQVRLDVIVNQLAVSRENIPKSLRLFVRTLQTSKVLRSRQFSDILSKLKTRPILSDPEIRSLDGLDIEVLGRWAAPDVKNFTPWIKLSELSRLEGVESIKEWSLQAFDKFAESCQKSLAHSNNFTELLSLRADTVELWLSSWGSTITHGSVDVLERLRKTFNDHLKRVLAGQVQSIDEVAGQISSTISAWETTEHETFGSLWDPDIINADFSNGAVSFKQTVADRLLGRDEHVSTVLRKYKSWLASIQEVDESIDSLRRLKWTDILVGSEVDDEDIDVNPQLNEEDPKVLSDALHSAVQEALDSLKLSVGDVFKGLGPSHASEKAVFLLRVIRLVRRDVPTDFLAKDFTFSSNVVPELQKLLAADIVAQNGSLSLVPSSKCHPETGKAKVVPGRSLWEGAPPVPVQPSPGTFKYLRRLTATMDENGSDLWDPSTVKVLKESLQKHLETALGSTLEELEAWKPEINEPKTQGDKDAQNGDEEEDAENSPETETETTELPNSPSHTEVLHDWKVQLFFDAMYLANMLGDATQLAGVAERVQKSAGPGAEAVKAMRKLAQEYWKRTEMLFGLLAER
ncbi:hypothetical protein N7448_008437 [Penicillium atrosanguineum]|uniref:Conserved oligomeric Golgi complex subunit 1 n=1 Tax=Penicillium atrosanguineum TaxID=1132637 RepID=A0A9W9QCG1_9EURO|nr:hypothetical protein N7448_008437 [Penicillium atrosanguineum]KAJ5147867.1 hypothetical protein N7526_001219 [Penicillium atrosanguineum]KAJ5330835.1 hypothetical protein N7476_000618 [Penicillium atrosanguineum]